MEAGEVDKTASFMHALELTEGVGVGCRERWVMEKRERLGPSWEKLGGMAAGEF